MNKHLFKLHKLFFYLFLLTWPLTIRKILYYYPINSNFNEYTSISLYLSDIFLLLCILFWMLSRLSHNYGILSILSTFCSTWNKINRNKLFHVEQNKPVTFYTQVIHNYNVLLLITFFLYSLLSTSWSKVHILALFTTFTYLKLFLIYIYFKNNVPRGTLLKLFLWITISSGILNSIVAILQFLFQQSLGLQFIGESILSPTMPGIAKLNLDDYTFIRAYGLLPHSNILGGFLLFSLICTYLYAKLFHVEQFKQFYNFNCSTWNNFLLFISSNVPRGTFLNSIYLIQVIGLFLSFSKSAIFGLLIFIFGILKFVPRGTNSYPKQKLFHVEQFKTKISFFALFSALFLLILLYLSLSQSLTERSLYINVSRGTISNHFLVGVGSGQYLISMYDNYKTLETWQYQPVHNIFLLFTSEYGLIGLIIALFMFINKIVPRGTINFEIKSRIILIAIASYLPIMLFDHYLIDINQGKIILTLLLSLF